MLHYVEPTLDTGYHNTAIVHVDLLNDKLPNNTDNLTSNLVNFLSRNVNRVTNLFIPVLLLIKDCNIHLSRRLMKKLKICVNHEIIFMDSCYLCGMNLYQNGFDLIERGKMFIC